MLVSDFSSHGVSVLSSSVWTTPVLRSVILYLSSSVTQSLVFTQSKLAFTLFLLFNVKRFPSIDDIVALDTGRPFILTDASKVLVLPVNLRFGKGWDFLNFWVWVARFLRTKDFLFIGVKSDNGTWQIGVHPQEFINYWILLQFLSFQSSIETD